MILFRINQPRFEDSAEGEDMTEWFPSLATASRRFNEIKKERSGDAGTVTLEKVELTKLPPKQFALAILNRRGFVVKTGTIREADLAK